MDLIVIINASPNALASPVNLIKDDYTQYKLLNAYCLNFNEFS